MEQKSVLAERLRRIGFRCIQCGSCCREISPGSNVIMICPEEIRNISLATGNVPNEISDPFPDSIDFSDGLQVTFEWCLKRKNGTCIFAEEHRCSIYLKRPWICHTFPFALEGTKLLISDCPGIGLPMGYDESISLAGDLIQRSSHEEKENLKIQDLMTKSKIPDADLVVIDGEGFTCIKKSEN